MRLGEAILAPARSASQQAAWPQAFAACLIVPAQMGKAIGEVAALTIALQAAHILQADVAGRPARRTW